MRENKKIKAGEYVTVCLTEYEEYMLWWTSTTGLMAKEWMAHEEIGFGEEEEERSMNFAG